MKGYVKVIKKDLKVHFLWKPDKNGTKWDIDALRSLLSVEEIKLEVPDNVLEKALAFFAEHSEEAETDVIVQGVKPVAPEPLKVDIPVVDLPSPVKNALDGILRDSSSEKNENDEDSEKSENSGENSHKKTTVYSWAEKGTVIGTVTPAVEARAGLDLNREPIDPPEMKGEDFIIGENLEIKGTNLIASAEGVVRIESSWADLVPAALHRWELSGGPEEGGCFLSYTPGHPAIPPPSPAEIINEAVHIGYLPEKLISEMEIRSLLALCISEKKTLVKHPVSKDTDSYIGIEIDSLKIKAELKLRRHTGTGRPLKLDDIAAAIRNSGLKGIDGASVKEQIMKFWKSQELLASIVLKEGVPPERGPDREIEFLVPSLEEEEMAPILERVTSNPKIYMGIPSVKEFPPSAVTKMAIVEKSQAIAKLMSAKTGKPGRDIYGNEIPGFPGNDPEIKIHEGLSWAGDTIVTSEDGLAEAGKPFDGATHLRVRPHKDALIQITVSEDKLKAFAATRLPVGSGAPVSVERLKAELEKAGVVKGILEDVLEEIEEKSLNGEIITGKVVAEGRLPMKENTRLSLRVSGDPAASPIPVKTGDLIGIVQKGEDSGWNVFGEPVLEGVSAVTEGENILKEEKDGKLLLIAGKGGHLVMRDGQLTIRHLLDYVGDVSLTTGNVRFPGKIKIDGSVLPRVVVDGGEGVEITQVVEAALINSGKDVIIGNGIKGEGKAVVRCQGKLYLGYAEAANLLTTDDIIVKKALMNCRIKCNGKIEFSSPGGKLIGGVLKIKNGIICGEIGNERGTATTISFGQDYLVENQIEQVQKEINKINEYMERIDELMKTLEHKKDSSKLISLRKKKVDAIKILDKKNLRLFLLREKFEQHFASEIRVTGTVWPGVTFESHGRILKTDVPLKSVIITFNREKGRLEKKPLR